MKPLKKHLIPGLAALAVTGALAGAATAAAPDPQPFFPSSDAALGTDNWYVDTTRAGGNYEALYRHPVQIFNDLGGDSGAGNLQIVVTPASATGGTTSRTGGATQKYDATSKPLAPAVTTATTSFDGVSTYLWGVKDLIAYTLTPASGAAVPSAIAATCWYDGVTYLSTGCSGDADGVGFISGIGPGQQDTIAIGSADNSPAFDITNVTPGTGSVTAQVSSALDDVDPSNNTALTSLKVPGVTSQNASASTTTTTPVAVKMTAGIVAPEVLGRRLDAGGPPAPAAADGSLVYTVVSGPSHGALSGVNASTGAGTYTAAAGFTGTDSFTYYAEDSRGLRSPVATVTVTVNAASSGGGTTPGGGGTNPGGGGTNPGGGGSSSPAKFTLSAKQLLINQRIGQAAIRRLAAVEAKLDGRPAPTFPNSGKAAGKVTLSANQLLINQRIYQAAIRRAAILEARLDNKPAPTFGSGKGGTVTLSLRQLIVNQRIAQAAVRRANALQARVGI